jgi:hypothetical protein
VHNESRVPIVTVTGEAWETAWRITLRRPGKTEISFPPFASKLTAESVAAEVRGALADAYHAGAHEANEFDVGHAEGE